MSFVWNRNKVKDALGIDAGFEFISQKIEFNSKNVQKNDIFIALKGENRDGHEFLEDAIKNGACFAIISKENNLDIKTIVVEDCFTALKKLSDYKRNTVNAKYISVTGSVGKTTTKEFLKAAFSSFGNIHANKSSFNNYLGVPLTLSSIPEGTDYVINEIGMNREGEIRNLSNIIKPDIAIITRIAEAHIENLGSIENICKAKCEIFENLNKDGYAIINSSSPCFSLQLSILKNLGIKNILTFGSKESDDCYLQVVDIHEDNMRVKYIIDSNEYTLNLNISGVHNAYNIASVLLAIYASSLNVENACKNLENISSFEGRGKIFNINLDDNNITLIDDAYNANPTSVSSALDRLSHYKIHKTAILSDMLELGKDAQKMHSNLAYKIIQSGVNTLITFGPLMKFLHEEVKDRINSIYYESVTNDNFEDLMKKLDQKTQVILVKGSNSTKIRNFVDFLINKKS